MLMKRIYILLVLAFFSFSLSTFAQINKGGTPLSFTLGSEFDVPALEIVPQLDMALVAEEDAADVKNGEILKAGRSIPVDFTMSNSGTWTELRNGGRMWRLTIQSKYAQALSLVYENFKLPVGAKLFVYNKYKSQILGAYTYENNHSSGMFSHEIVQGDEITIEYIEPKFVAGHASFKISELVYVYRFAEKIDRYNPEKTTGWGASEACEVNINCSPVGDNWQDEKRGVAEIWLRVGASWGWCSGTLVNNTSNDETPYFLTADHCGGTDASTADLLVWSFYFKYESATCTTPGTEPAYQTLTGAVRRAVGPISGGSDFFLLELNTTPGAAINPYYNGWDRTNTTPSYGTGIHHPAGDIKKISTCDWLAIGGPVNIGGSIMAANSVFEIEWASNANGFGVTEGGSSGSPLFNNAGLQVGTLSGGSSTCASPASHDYYGRFYYHWNQNPGGTATQLQTWLDPTSTGATTCPGYDPFATAPPTVDFYGTPRIILQGQTVNFTDQSYGTPFTAFNWTFQSGTPGTSTLQNPVNITYNTPGTFDVTESVTNAFGTTVETKADYIRVLSNSAESCDTLVTFVGTPTIYTSANGYVGGTNEYTCLAIAEKFATYSPFNEVYGGRFYWADVDNGTSPNVTFILWAPDAAGKPGTQITTTTIPLATIASDFNSVGYTDVNFGSEFPIPTNGFFIGFMIPGAPASGDTLAIVTNNDADSNDDTGYSLYGTSWETYAAWGMSLMNAITPFACYDPFLPPVADFSGTPRTLLAGNTVAFTDISYGGAPTSWSWTFAGGTPATATTQNPTITYNTPGYYAVTLTATNAYGSDSETKTNYIEVLDPNACNCAQLGHVVGSEVVYTTTGGYLSGSNEYADKVKAEYFADYAPYSIVEGVYIRFGAVHVANTATNITINLYDDNGAASGGGTHTFSPGTVLATKTVPITTIAADVAAGDSTYIDFTSPVTISSPFFIGFVIPTPSATSDSIAVMTGAQGAGTDDGWEQWSDNVWYSYTEAGWGGSFNNAIYPVACSPGSPLADFTANTTTVGAGQSVTFTDMSYCTPTSWSWTLPGGTPATATTQNPVITYNTPGTYDVTLQATNATGSGTELKTQYITVLSPIVYWNFPNNPDNATSDGGIAANNGTKSISVVGGVTAPTFATAGATTRCASAVGWASGSGLKYWQVNFETTGYGDLIFSSKMAGNNVRSASDFKVQYRVGAAGVWTDVPTANIDITAINNWTVGNLANIALPVACENQADIYLRWIMTSNTGINGTQSVQAGNATYIDDIYVYGVSLATPPVANFTASATTGCEGVSITFTDASTNSPTSWAWDFGGGATNSALQNPTVTFNTAGTYTITLTATNAYGNDSEVKTAYITIWDRPTATTSVTNVACFGGVTGTVTATPSGGTSPFTYLWNDPAPAQTTQTATALTAGTYNVTVTDSHSCTVGASATVTQPASALSSSITAQTNISCNGGSNGSATVTATGGTGTYTYLWNDPAPAQTTATATALTVGTWTVTVTDANGCTSVSSATITQPTALTVSMSGTNVSCFGGSNGTATATPSGGTGAYSYLWNDPAPAQTTATCTGLTAGTWSVTITDANGCTVTGSRTVTQPATSVNASTTGTNVTCFGGSNGTATVTASGGTSPYTYLWNDPAPAQTTATCTGLTAGTWTVTVTDANGCTATANRIITQPASALSGSTSVVNVTCNGGSNGSATVTVSGGTSPYTYLWNDPAPAQTTPTATALTAGTWTVTITDLNTCTATANAIVTQPAAISLSTTTVNASCGNSDGSATVTASGGTSPYTYLWNDPAPVQTTATATGLASGSYTVTVTDAGGCSNTATANINDSGAPTVTISSSTNASCFGVCDGTATVSVSGGTLPYTYLWSSGNTTATATGLCSGTVSVDVTDAAGCNASTSVVITQPAILAFTIASSTNASCFGVCDGTATTTISGGTPSYTYAWSNGVSTANLTGLCDGAYIGTVTDSHGCTASASISITEPTELIASSSVTDVSCFGENDGSATVSVTGGTPVYTYIWSNGGSASTESGLIAGSYVVTVIDSHACSDVIGINVTSPTEIVVNLTHTDITCFSANDGTAAVSVTGGSPSYTYNWSVGGTGTSVSGLSAGVVEITVTDASGCSVIESTTIAEPAPLSATIFTQNNVTCFGLCDGAVLINVTGGTPSYTYLWSTGATTNFVTGLCAGSYSLTVYDANGCSSILNITITEPAQLIVSETVTDANCGLSDGSISLNVTGGTSPYSYEWDGGEITSGLTNIPSGVYTVTVTDFTGCEVIMGITVNDIGGASVIVDVLNVECFGESNGQATANVTGGTSPYIFNWSSGGSGVVETGLAAGSYTVTVEDATGCQTVESFSVTEPAELVLTMSSTDETPVGASNGTATVSISGGTPAYIIQWSNDESSETITGLATGWYFVTVTDSYSCIEIDSVFVDFQISISENSNGGYRIYPNPTNGIVTVELQSLDITRIEITDVIGKQIMNIENVSDVNRFDLSPFKAGVYFINLYSEKGKLSDKLILNQ